MERRRQIQAQLQLLGDLVATAAAVLVAYALRFEFPVYPVTKGVPDLEHYLVLIPIALVVWPAVFYFQGLYTGRRIRSRAEELMRVVTSVVISTVVLIAASTFYRPPEFTYSRLYLAIFAVVNLVLVVATRWSLSWGLGRIRRSGRNLRNVLVIGAGELGREVVERFDAHREFGFRVVGFLDDDPGLRECGFHGVPVLGTTADLESVVEARAIDQVVLALPLSAQHKTAQLLPRASQLLVEVKVVPDLLQFAVARGGVEDLDGMPMVNLTRIPLQGWNQVVKRAFDIAGSALLLAVFSPLFPVIAWAVKRIDGGPVFFSQVRTGLDGRSFRIFKFRTMREHAEDDRTWTRSTDDRVTAIGGFLRRSNLDELPQLYNVLRGDMSLVGPRPEQPQFVERFRERYPEYNIRHRVRTGMTGWAQVNGLRGDTSIRQRVMHDLYYIQNWSFGLDLKILWRTLRLTWSLVRS